MGQRFTLLDFPPARFATLLRFVVQRLRYGGGTAHFTEHEHINFEVATLVFYPQTIADVHLARRLGRLAV